MKLIVTGSIAYDYLMSFSGRFADGLPAARVERMNVSLLVDSMSRQRGGCAPNIAYTLALLRERPCLMAAAGHDFGEYRQWLEAIGVDTSLVTIVPDKLTASYFCSTDSDASQISYFYAGAMMHAAELSFRTIAGATLVIIAPNDPAAMLQYADECRSLNIPFIFDPGQECARMSGEQLRSGLAGAKMVIGNAEDFELVRAKTGLGEREILRQADLLVITRGAGGCSLYQGASRADVKAVAPHRVVDRTGVGDAFRGGFMKGLAEGAPYTICAQLGSVAATYALEHLGATSHTYTLDEFKRRYEEHFGALTV
jgi:adenosine kinase